VVALVLDGIVYDGDHPELVVGSGVRKSRASSSVGLLVIFRFTSRRMASATPPSAAASPTSKKAGESMRT